MDTPEQNSQLGGALPIISAETEQRVVEEIGIDVDRKTRQVLSGITDEPEESPTLMLASFAQNVFTNIADVNPELVRTLQKGIHENLYASVNSSRRDAVIEGMAVVIRAFDIESGFNLANNFVNLKQEDMQRVNDIIKKSLGSGRNRDLLEKVLEMPKIPEQQIALNTVLRKAIQVERIYENEVRSGGAIMYNILSEMSSELYPPKPPTFSADTPPQTGV